jgi:hypothetical protein
MAETTTAIMPLDRPFASREFCDSNGPGEEAARENVQNGIAKGRQPEDSSRYRDSNSRQGELVNSFRLALANVRFPAGPDESVALAAQAVEEAAIERAQIICLGSRVRSALLHSGKIFRGTSYHPDKRKPLTGVQRLLLLIADTAETGRMITALRGHVRWEYSDPDFPAARLQSNSSQPFDQQASESLPAVVWRDDQPRELRDPSASSHASP